MDSNHTRLSPDRDSSTASWAKREARSSDNFRVILCTAAIADIEEPEEGVSGDGWRKDKGRKAPRSLEEKAVTTSGDVGS
jgi:hypothetical protein